MKKKKDFDQEFVVFADIFPNNTEYCEENCGFNSIKPEALNNC